MRIALVEPILRTFLRLCHCFDRRRRDETDVVAAREVAEIRRILIVSCTALGDTLLSSPAFHSLRLAYSQAHITLLGHPAYRALYAGHPDTDEFVAYDGSWRRFWSVLVTLRRQPYDMVCILHGNEPQVTPLCYLAGIRFIYKLPNTSRYGFLLSNRRVVKGWDDFGHGIEQRLETARQAGGAEVGRTMTLVERDAETAILANQLAQRGIGATAPIVLFQPGASTNSRRWAKDRFAELGRRLLAAYPNLTVVVTGGPDERDLCNHIAAAIGGKRVWSSAGEVSLARLPALFRRAEALVSGDTGPMHLAVAVGTPVVALFAVSDYRRSGPAYDLSKHFVIQKWRTCEPCLSKRCPYAEPICMGNISVDEVDNAVSAIISRKRVVA